MPSTSAPIRIAIVGGGIAGATLANALSRIPHLALEVFEAAPEFSERGAAIGLSPNYLAALNHIFAKEDDVLARAGAVPMNSTRLVLVSGKKETCIKYTVGLIEANSLLKGFRAPGRRRHGRS